MSLAMWVSGEWMGMDRPMLFADPSECQGVDLRAAGFVPFSREIREVPPVQGINVDVSKPREVDLYRPDDSGQWVPFGGYAFPEPTPRQVWDRVHADANLVVVVTDPRTFTGASTLFESIERLERAEALIGVLPLLAYVYADGVGTHPTGQEPV